MVRAFLSLFVDPAPVAVGTVFADPAVGLELGRRIAPTRRPWWLRATREAATVPVVMAAPEGPTFREMTCPACLGFGTAVRGPGQAEAPVCGRCHGLRRVTLREVRP